MKELLIATAVLALLAPAIPAQAAPQIAQGTACFASEPDSGTELERLIHAAIRKSFEREAPPGLDGKVTVKFDALQIGRARPWQAAEMGTFANGDQSRPIYDVHAVFSTCTDYHRSISVTRRDRVFVCFLNQFAAVDCQITTRGPTPDQTQSVQK